jgi:hypothetical protein
MIILFHSPPTKMNILQIPIIDEFSAAASLKRDVQFATDKGLWTQNPRKVPFSSTANVTNPNAQKTGNKEANGGSLVAPEHVSSCGVLSKGSALGSESNQENFHTI